MAVTMEVLEGTWEEILGHAEQLKGHRVRVTVLPDQQNGSMDLSDKQREMLAALDEWHSEITDEDKVALEELERFIYNHPFDLTWPRKPG
jgi:hypothetical protein